MKARWGGGGKKWTYVNILKDKFLRLLIPGLAFSVFATILKLLFPGEMDRPVTLSIDYFAHVYLYPYDNPMRELWFIVTLYWMFVLTPVWKYVLSNEVCVSVTALVLVFFMYYHPDTDLLCFRRIFGYAFWFYMGMLMCKYNLVESFVRPYKIYALLISLVVYIVGLNTTSQLAMAGGITISIALALYADENIPKIFSTYRLYTYQIFLMGIFAQYLVKIIYRRVDIPYVAGYILCMLFGLYVPVIVSKVAERLKFKPLNMCIGLK